MKFKQLKCIVCKSKEFIIVSATEETKVTLGDKEIGVINPALWIKCSKCEARYYTEDLDNVSAKPLNNTCALWYIYGKWYMQPK